MCPQHVCVQVVVVALPARPLPKLLPRHLLSSAGRGVAVAQALAQAQATSAQQVREEGLLDERVMLDAPEDTGHACMRAHLC